MLKLSKRGRSNEERKLLPSKEGGAGGVLARTTGRTLPNKHPPMVAGWRGLLCRHFGGVRIMREKCSECSEYRNSLSLFGTAYGVICADCINKIEREVNH